MLANIEILQPGWLAAGVAVLAAVSVFLRPRPAAMAANAAAPPAVPGNPMATTSAARAWLRRLQHPLLAAAVMLAAVWLATAGTAAGQIVLVALALAASLAAARSYQRRRGLGRGLVGAALVALRALALALILLLLARPQWSWTEHAWQHPLLVLLLDDSDSMNIIDRGPDQKSRAARVEEALRGARDSLDAARARYSVEVRRLSDLERFDEATYKAGASATPLASGLRAAAGLRSEGGDPPDAILLVSDGRDTNEPERELRTHAAALRAQKTALLGFGAGPAASADMSIHLDPLAVPERVGAREKLAVPITGMVRGLPETNLRAELFWNGAASAEKPLRLATAATTLRVDFETTPPGPGLHRLTGRVTLPEKLGGGVFERSAIIDARDERIRVLYVDSAPRSEAGFVARAWQGDGRLEVTRQLWSGTNSARSAPGAAARPRWDAHDVIVLAGIPDDAGSAELRNIAEAVRERGVGLLLAGGPALFNDPGFSRSALAEISPVRFDDTVLPDKEPFRLTPTPEGLLHPVLRGLAGGANAAWAALAPLAGAARLGEPRKLAQVLARDEAGRPLMVAHEIGAGRALAAAWQSTWPWALASDEGFDLHRRFWRQLAIWLANKRPRLWLLTDDTRYALAPLKSGQRAIRVRAGISGGELSAEKFLSRAGLHLTLKPAGDAKGRTVVVPLSRDGDEFSAEIRADLLSGIAAGAYELELTLAQRTTVDRPSKPDLNAAGGAAADAGSTLPPARARFEISDVSLERQPPSADLALLKDVSELTRPEGGGYHPVSELSAVLGELAKRDQRVQLRRARAFDASDRFAWPLLAAALVALALEWAIRKRLGGV